LVDLMLLELGGLAGFTIFLGLPVARLKGLSTGVKGFLNAISIGILLFLLVEVLPVARETVEGVVLSSIRGASPLGDGFLFVATLLSGFALGLMSLVWYENRFVRVPGTPQELAGLAIAQNGKGAINEKASRRLAMMIAVGLGVHNFSEGLAIGSQYVSGALTLAILLVVGFGAHNATEGFGIAAPLTGTRPKWSFLLLAGLVGGGPTLMGTIVGSAFVSPILSVLFLSVAGGALFFVIMTLYGAGRRQSTNHILMVGILLGFLVGYLTDLVLVVSGV